MWTRRELTPLLDDRPIPWGDTRISTLPNAAPRPGLIPARAAPKTASVRAEHALPRSAGSWSITPATLHTLPRGVARCLADGLPGEPAGLVRAAALVASLSLTTVGFAKAGSRRRLAARRR